MLFHIAGLRPAFVHEVWLPKDPIPNEPQKGTVIIILSHSPPTVSHMYLLPYKRLLEKMESALLSCFYPASQARELSS